MKKSDITASLLIIITCVLVVIFLGLRSIDGYVGGGGTAPSYRFLEDQDPLDCKKADKRTGDSRGIEDRRYTYSFEADYNDLCSKAYAELIPEAFSANTIVGEAPFGDEYRLYYRKERFPRGPVYVYIYDNVQYIKHTTPDNYGIAPKDGWVMVVVDCRRGWRWPF